MKKSILIILSVLFCVSCFAQKKYLLIRGGAHPTNDTFLSGDIPSGYYESYRTGYSNFMTTGQILNKLITEEGFVVEFFTGESTISMLLSRQVNNEDDAISIVHNDDGDVREVARYNLQGMQVNENTKGIQIVVYSNYTTKTVIVE